MAEIIPAVSAASGVLRITSQLVTLTIQTSQVNDEIRKCLQQVRTCDRSLQQLISLRDELLDILERKPTELDRINMLIEDAHEGLLEVGRIVERCRPEANRGRIPFTRRSRWVFFDASNFYSQIPVIAGHHREVLSEVAFLRQIALRVPAPVPGQTGDGSMSPNKGFVTGTGSTFLTGHDMVKDTAAERHPAPASQGFATDPSSRLNKSQFIPPSLPRDLHEYEDDRALPDPAVKHINLNDIEASGGGVSRMYEVLQPSPYGQSPDVKMERPQFGQQRHSTRTNLPENGPPSSFLFPEPQSQHHDSADHSSDALIPNSLAETNWWDK